MALKVLLKCYNSIFFTTKDRIQSKDNTNKQIKQPKQSDDVFWKELDSKLQKLKYRSNSTTNSTKAFAAEIKTKTKTKDTAKRKPFKYNKFMELISINKVIPYQNQKTKEGIKEINQLITSDIAYCQLQLLTASNEGSTKLNGLFHHNSSTSLLKSKNNAFNGAKNNLSSSVNFNQKLNSRNKLKDSLSKNSSVNIFEEKKALEDFRKSFDSITTKKQGNIKNDKYKKLHIPFEENKGKKDLFIDF